MDEVQIRSNLNTQRSNLQSSLLQSGDQADNLLSIASKRNRDRIDIKLQMLTTHVTDQLDATIAEEVARFPELVEDAFIAISRSDDGFSVEVWDQATAETTLSTLYDPETAERLLEKKISFFNTDQLSAKTANSDAHQKLKSRLTSFFTQHGNLFRYLQSNQVATTS